MRRFELIDEKSRKFWEIDVRCAKLTVRFGRLGTAGTTRTKLCSSDAAATAEALKLVREKTSKGYIEVAIDTTAAIPAAESAAGLSRVELDAIAGLLELAAPEYEGHSSNDYDVPADDGNRSVIAATIEYGNRVLAESEKHRFGECVERNGRIFIWDVWLIRYLAHRCRSILGTPGAAAGFTEAEGGLLATLLEDLARDDCNLFERAPAGEDFSLAATDEHKALLAAALRHAGGADLAAKLRDLKNADDLVAAYAVDVLRWLAVRCRETAGRPPAVAGAAGTTTAPNRLGVLKGWISEKTLIKRATAMDWSWRPAYTRNDADLETYASGGNPFHEYQKPDVPSRPPFADSVCNRLLQYERSKRERGVILSLFGNQPDSVWQSEYDRHLAYDFWQLAAEIQFQGHVEFGRCVDVLANCVYAGHWPQAKYLARSLQGSMVSGNVRMNDALTLYQWWLQICFKYFQLAFEPAHWWMYAQRGDLYARGECFGEPVLNVLVGHWRDPDLSALSPQLIWLCDYYTHRTRYAEHPEPKTEFGSDWIADRLPVVILAWFRFRESLGLTNPQIDHPLMKARYVRLYPPRPMFSERLLERVIARLQREELPILGDLADATICEPKRWRINPADRESKPYESVSLEQRQAPGYALYVDLPPGYIDRSLPEMLRFVEPGTGTELWCSAYRNPGVAAPDWAEIVVSNFLRTAPRADRVTARTVLPSWNWTGIAQEFHGIAGASPELRHCLVVAGKSDSTLLALHVLARPDVYSAQSSFYRWLIEWKFCVARPYDAAVVAQGRQDIPGYERVAPDPDWLRAEKQFEIGMRHYRGTGTGEAEQIATRDRALAAAWFDRAAEQDHGKAQFNLAVLLKNADGVPQDIAAALRWAKRARLRGVERAPQLIRELEALARKTRPFWKIW